MVAVKGIEPLWISRLLLKQPSAANSSTPLLKMGWYTSIDLAPFDSQSNMQATTPIPTSEMVAQSGLEPKLKHSECLVLPLHYRAINWSQRS